MKHLRLRARPSTVLNLLLTVGLLLALGSGVAGPPYRVLARGTGSQGGPLGSSFTYQGRLIRDTAPVDGVTCDFTFDLYDVATGGTRLETDSKSASVEDGYFSVALDFGSEAFTGEARWLAVAVHCPGDAFSVPLDDQRMSLTAAPYAHSLRPGSTTSGSASGAFPGQAVLNVENKELSAGRAAIFGISGSWVPGHPDKEAGVRGEAADGYGVVGRSTSSTGVVGLSTSGDGVLGRSTDNYGVYGISSNGYGVVAVGGAGDLGLRNGTIYATEYDDSDLALHSNNNVDVHLDDDDNSTSQFRIFNGADAVVFAVDESGVITGNLGPANGWALTGNAGTNPGANFLGTTDNHPLELRVNDTRALRLEPNTVSPNFVGGYGNNDVTAGVVGAAIGGGGAPSDFWGGPYPNRVTDAYGTVGGGAANQAGDDADTTYNADFATVGGGFNNTASGAWSTVAGGQGNEANNQSATVAGGTGNQASEAYATVGGGDTNRASEAHATVGGGFANYATGEASTVGGGTANEASGEEATVSGGELNRARGNHATVGGGFWNTASGAAATIGGGQHISATGWVAVVSGGSHITVTGNYATVGGGGFNTASGHGAVVAGGGGEDPILARTLPNTASGALSSIGGGGLNSASEGYATISGGLENSADAWSATIGGGEQITVSGSWATASGGRLNTAGGEYSTVSGGWSNAASGDQASIGGGWANSAGGNQSVVAGGYSNEASGDHGSVGGGYNNAASGNFATVVGGHSAQASSFGQVAHASGSFGDAGDAQGSFYVLRGTTYNSTPTELFLDGFSQRLIISDRTMTFDILVAARTSFPYSAGYTARGVIEGWGGGLVGFVFGTPTITNLGDDIGGTSFSVLAEQGALVLRVTGPSDKAVRWVATVRTAEVGW